MFSLVLLVFAAGEWWLLFTFDRREGGEAEVGKNGMTRRNPE